MDKEQQEALQDEWKAALADAGYEVQQVLRHGVLFRSLTGPAPLETLPKRTLAFLFQFADLCELFGERRKQAFTDLLDDAWPGMAEAWTTIETIEIGEPAEEEST